MIAKYSWIKVRTTIKLLPFLFACFGLFSCVSKDTFYPFQTVVTVVDFNEKPIKGIKVKVGETFPDREKTSGITDANGKVTLNYTLLQSPSNTESTSIFVEEDSLFRALDRYGHSIPYAKPSYTIHVDSFAKLKVRLQKTDTLPLRLTLVAQWANKNANSTKSNEIFSFFEKNDVGIFDTTLTLTVWQKTPFEVTAATSLVNFATVKYFTKTVQVSTFRDSTLLIRF
jgi:hypothetical protein